MSVSKELSSCIKSFLSVCNIPIEKSTYLETGLFKGDSVQYALDLNFKKVISIDIDKNAIDNANQRFKNEVINSRVLLVQGDSQEKIKEIFDQSINIIYLDAHNNEVDEATIAPLENEIKFLLDKVNEGQLIIIDDYLKIKNSFLFANNKKSWKSKLSDTELKEIISGKGLNTFELFSNSGASCHLLLTKNKDFRIDKIFFLKNLINRFLSIRFYYKKNYFRFMFKKLIIFLLPDKVYKILKGMLKRN